MKNDQRKLYANCLFFSPVGLNLGNCRYAHLSSCPPSAESGIRANHHFASYPSWPQSL